MNDTYEVKLKRRHPSLIILKALLDGHQIEKDNELYAISEENDLIIKRWKTKIGMHFDIEPDRGKEVWLPVDFSLKNFIKWSEKFTLEELTLIIGNSVLTDMANEKAEKRERLNAKRDKS
jgi:hypothetical protein